MPLMLLKGLSVRATDCRLLGKTALVWVMWPLKTAIRTCRPGMRTPRLAQSRRILSATSSPPAPGAVSSLPSGAAKLRRRKRKTTSRSCVTPRSPSRFQSSCGIIRRKTPRALRLCLLLLPPLRGSSLRELSPSTRLVA
ncbi:hypothetical protein H310_06645 [Aphanomyces invadans]|uniref:Uncharacterized protein n=1 Tax=Aphanomyces invadans TaxID=157072 RepID=A0A024U445_9STRA|nr:hypothetical protein H310_06645 [Aphanomyces invadans]ETW01009.1 hypothetical protein H310_06645 [Aphanomyces invadans]|eukprot:XP_008870007.1 hypothetical protein H310_06645 [Aphanomyces invadans]